MITGGENFIPYAAGKMGNFTLAWVFTGHRESRIRERSADSPNSERVLLAGGGGGVVQRRINYLCNAFEARRAYTPRARFIYEFRGVITRWKGKKEEGCAAAVPKNVR